MSIDLVTICVAAFFAMLMTLRRKRPAQAQLAMLAKRDLAGETSRAEIDWSKTSRLMAQLKDRWGRAGCFTARQRRRAKVLTGLVIGGSAITGLLLGLRTGAGTACIGAGAGVYLGAMGWLYYLRAKARDVQRQILFELPLALESIILLVESGLGVLPALEQFVRSKHGKTGSELSGNSPVKAILGLAYELSASGLPFRKALELISDATDVKVLSHTLLHLDLANSEGGALLPSLRSLSEHAHTEWRMSVETRVRRLENLVVFPVFCAVLGLMLLTVSVPMVPVLKFMDKMSAKQPVMAVAQPGISRAREVVQ